MEIQKAHSIHFKIDPELLEAILNIFDGEHGKIDEILNRLFDYN